MFINNHLGDSGASYLTNYHPWKLLGIPDDGHDQLLGNPPKGCPSLVRSGENTPEPLRANQPDVANDKKHKTQGESRTQCVPNFAQFERNVAQREGVCKSTTIHAHKSKCELLGSATFLAIVNRSSILEVSQLYTVQFVWFFSSTFEYLDVLYIYDYICIYSNLKKIEVDKILLN